MVVWCAGDIASASADTMEKESLRRDGEDWGVYFRHSHRYLFSRRSQ
jgi:hypothetical protein